MDNGLVANRNTYFGVFFLTLSILMSEILLTRIFSVITYYHFAFMAISIVMFGMAVGSMLVFLMPAFQNKKNLHLQLVYFTLLFSLTTVAAFFVLATTRFIFYPSWFYIARTALIYCTLAVPFIFGGISVCLVLTKFTKQINSLYAADLIGAAFGCIVSIVVLNYVSGPLAVITAALLGICSTLFFSKNTHQLWLKRITWACLFAFLVLIAYTSFLNFHGMRTPVRLKWVKSRLENTPPNYEKWNSFSRITVVGDPTLLNPPFTQGLSDAYPLNEKVHAMTILIDAGAATFLMNYHNTPDEINFLKYDITGFANYLKPNSKVMTIGVGGGRDILTALAFNQREIVGVEINPIIIDLLRNRYALFTGNLDKNPRVTLINAEARSYVAQLPEKFDLIQIALIDTWAATAAGAYVLSENSLYTTQAWKIFLTHLNSNGLLTVTRWYNHNRPEEVYRLTALASKTLHEMGVNDTASHIMVFASEPFHNISDRINSNRPFVGNVIVSPDPLSQETILTAEAMAKKLDFTILYTPNQKGNSIFADIAKNADTNAITDAIGNEIAAPTDDKPFFFESLKFSYYLKHQLWNSTRGAGNAITILLVLLITVVVLTFACIVLPTMMKTNRALIKNGFPFIIYFASIGLGFMFIEISQLQRFVLFLGPPTYGLSVILFGLLLSSGLGSLVTTNLLYNRRQLFLSQILLLLTVGIFGYFTGDIIQDYQAATLVTRILISLGVILPLGFFMGSALPLGMQLASWSSSQLTPWLWGINGATSICGSVLAMVIALTAGIQSTYWTGMICYCVAFLAISYVFLRQTPVKVTTDIL